MRDCGESSPGPSRSWWRTLLWLSFWIILPAYGFYALSLQPPASPGDWLASAGSLLTGRSAANLTTSSVLGAILVLLTAAAGVAAVCHVGLRHLPILPRYITVAAIAAFALTLLLALVHTGRSAGLAVPSAARWSAAIAGLLAGAGLLITGYILWRGPRPALPGLPVGQVSNLPPFPRTHSATQHHARPDGAARGTSDNPIVYSQRIILVLLAAGALPTGVASGLLGLWIARGIHHRHSWDLLDHWLAIVTRRPVLMALLAAAIGLSFHHAGRTIRQRLAKSVILIAIVASVLLLCLAIHQAAVARGQQIVWFPRYLGVIWPAMAIAVAALIMRLPHWSLRALVLVVLLSANLTQFFAWIYVPADPPVDVQSADAVAAKLNPREMQVYFNGPDEGHARSIESIYSNPGRYYILTLWGSLSEENYKWLKTHNCHSTNRWLLGWSRDYFAEQFQIQAASERLLVSKLAGTPLVKRLIVWDQLAVSDTAPGPDTLSDRLGPGWRLVRNDWYPVRYLMRWHQMEPQRRREWQKIEQK